MLRSSLFWAGATATLIRHRRRFVMQTGRTDCGVACALTVMNMFGHKVDPVFAVDYLDTDRTGSTLDALRRYFEEQHGFEATSLQVPANRLNKVKGRLILHMSQQHYVVLLRRSRAGVLVFDPAMGPVYYPWADFAALYSGFLLEVRGRPRNPAETLPALPSVSAVIGSGGRRGFDPLALFVIGVASRLLEAALFLCIVAALFLLLNHASFPSMLTIAGIIAVCSGLLLMARQTRFEGEDRLGAARKGRIWRGLLRATLRGRDIAGFRGRMEKDVAGDVRKGILMGIPQRTQIPAALGAFFAMSGLLIFLNPWVALAHVVLMAGLLVIMQLDDIQVCRRSVRRGIGRYTRLSQSVNLPSGTVAPDMTAELAKWSVIGFAGYSVLLADFPPPALMFWILAGMQLVPVDFRRASLLTPLLSTGEPVSSLVAAEVPLRRQRVEADTKVKVAREENVLRIDGITPLTATLQQPDLTVREQRLIMADVVRQAVLRMPEKERPVLGAIRIFGPGQDATQADFEHLLIAQEARPGETLPVLADTRQVIDKGAQDPVLRDLHSCAPGDFPVFWDFRNKLPIEDLRARLGDTDLKFAGHLTMKRLTVVEAA